MGLKTMLFATFLCFTILVSYVSIHIGRSITDAAAQSTIDQLLEEVNNLAQRNSELEGQVSYNQATVQQLSLKLKKQAVTIESTDQANLGTFKVTAYAPSAGGINSDGDSSTTATGTTPGPGTFAVDPDVIPYGSHIVVLYANGKVETGYAEDTGGAINGNHLDVFRNSYSDAVAFGNKEATVLWFKDGATK